MADKSESKLRYFRSEIAGLQVVVGARESGEIAPPTVQFEQFREKWQGDNVRVGYLATDNTRAIELLSNDHNVQEIDADEYAKATDPDVNPKVVRLAQ